MTEDISGQIECNQTNRVFTVTQSVLMQSSISVTKRQTNNNASCRFILMKCDPSTNWHQSNRQNNGWAQERFHFDAIDNTRGL